MKNIVKVADLITRLTLVVVISLSIYCFVDIALRDGWKLTVVTVFNGADGAIKYLNKEIPCPDDCVNPGGQH